MTDEQKHVRSLPDAILRELVTRHEELARHWHALGGREDAFCRAIKDEQQRRALKGEKRLQIVDEQGRELA